jgi:Flavin containing amine oxidoreductase
MKKATLLNMSNAHKRIADLERALKCVGDVLYDEGDPLIDHGVIKVLREDCGWTSSSNVDDAIQWDYIDYEYTGKDTSLYNFPQPDYLMDGLSEYIVIDQNGGYSSLATSFATDYGVSPYIDFNKTVTKIDYSHTGDANYKVKVDVRATSCTHYLAKYVILTVPVGVIANNLIEFHPPLFTTDNPLKMGLYIKIFYNFNFRVGPRYNHEFLWSVLQGSTSGDKDEHCMNWQNMDAKRHSKRRGTDTTYYPGAHVWVCTLTTVAFHKILAAGDGKRLSATQIDQLLNPLRQIFHDRAILPTDYKYYYPDWNLRDNAGNGAYSDWQIGYNLRQYYAFYGGGPIEPCEHNGCDANRKWRLHMSGTGSCLEEFEYVHGAYFSGQRSANYVLAEMGKSVDTNFLACEDLKDIVLPPVKG